MTAWQRAHLEILEHRALPVRTHEWRPPANDPASGPDEAELAARRDLTAQRRAQIRDLLAAGKSERAIAKLVGISRTSVQRHRRALAGLPWRWRGRSNG